MRIRGNRQCKSCGRTWSYYETSMVECPSCGSLQSKSTDRERRLHTATSDDYDLSEVRAAVDQQELTELAHRAVAVSREFVQGAGWIRGGALEPLDDRYLAAQELVHVGGLVRQGLVQSEGEQLYFLELLRGADAGARPETATIPESLRAGRVLGYAAAIEAYRADLRKLLDDEPEPAIGEILGHLRDHIRRCQALDGELDPAIAEELVAAIRELTEYIDTGDPTALESARGRLSGLV